MLSNKPCQGESFDAQTWKLASIPLFTDLQATFLPEIQTQPQVKRQNIILEYIIIYSIDLLKKSRNYL